MKPRTYGATTIRIVTPSPNQREVYFYDINEAKTFVNENWVQGKELSARVQDRGIWSPVYLINENGDIFISPIFDSLISQATVHRGNILQGV